MLQAADTFRAGPADSYAHQTGEQVTIGAKAFDKPDEIGGLFGKADLLKYGILPVLVVVENKGKESLDLQNVEVNLVATDGRHAAAVSPNELYHLGRSVKRPGMKAPIPLPKKKNALEAPEIVERAFLARMLPPGDTASGFFYFEAKSEKGDKLYVNGVRQARSQREMIYFEFPLEK